MVQKLSYDFEAKQVYRKIWRDFIARQFPKEKQRRGLRVACLPGHEGLEVIEVYDKLGIPRHRVYGIESKPDIARQIRNNVPEINVYEGEAIDFFRDSRIKERFDIVNLDFQGLLKNIEIETIQNIIHFGKYKPHFLFGSNFFGSRDGSRKESYNHLYSMGAGKETVNFIEQAYTGDDKSTILSNQFVKVELIGNRDLGDSLRSDAISFTLPYIINSLSFEELGNFFNLGELKGNEKILAYGYFRMLDARVQQLLSGINELPIELKWGLYIHVVENIRKRNIVMRDFYKGRYVSDSGSPMFFDFIHFLDQGKFDQKYEVDLKTFDSIKGRGSIFIEEKDRDSDPKFYMIGRKGITQINGFVDYKQNASEIADLFVKKGYNYDDGIIFFHGDILRYQFFLNQLFRHKCNLGFLDYLESQRVPIKIKTLEEKIQEDIVSGRSDEEIMSRHGIDRRKLGANRAALSRKNVEGNGSNVNNSHRVEFEEEDREVILGLISEGHKATQIASLFDGKYTWQSIAAIKATKNRSVLI